MEARPNADDQEQFNERFRRARALSSPNRMTGFLEAGLVDRPLDDDAIGNILRDVYAIHFSKKFEFSKLQAQRRALVALGERSLGALIKEPGGNSLAIDLVTAQRAADWLGRGNFLWRRSARKLRSQVDTSIYIHFSDIPTTKQQ